MLKIFMILARTILRDATKRNLIVERTLGRDVTK